MNSVILRQIRALQLSDVTLRQVVELVTWCCVRGRWSVTDGQADVDLLSNVMERNEWPVMHAVLKVVH